MELSPQISVLSKSAAAIDRNGKEQQGQRGEGKEGPHSGQAVHRASDQHDGQGQQVQRAPVDREQRMGGEEEELATEHVRDQQEGGGSGQFLTHGTLPR